MSIKDKLDYLQDTKQAIKTAIQSKGQSVSDADTFRSYADKINAITTGGGDSDETTKELVERTLTEFNDTAGSISKIGSYAFYSFSTLRSVSFPVCETIGYNAFYSCQSLTSVNFPNCTTIGYSAFAYCSRLTSVNFPNCTTMSNSAFYNCSRLTSVNFPNCTTMSNSAFAFCSTLTSVNFPNCTTIGSGAFNRCSRLTSVSFPVCKTIGSSAFYNCSSLQFMSLSRCISIGGDAFVYCQSLSAIYLQRRVTLGTSPFTLTPMVYSSYLGYFGSIYVRSTYLSWYQSATNWAQYSSRITTFKPPEATLQENGGDIASGTSLTITLDNCEVGDNLIAGVITRSESPVPSGWTLLGTAPTISSSSNTQYLNIYTKVATSTTETIEITQATAGRIYANIVNIKNKTANEIASLNQSTTTQSLTITKPTNNEILVFAEIYGAAVYGAFVVDGDYNYDYAYGDRGRLTMVHSTKPAGSEIIITSNSGSDVQWAIIGIELT